MLKFWRCIVNSSKQSFLSLQEKATTSYHQPKQRRRTALLQRGERSSCSTLFLQGDRGWEGGKSSSKAQRQPSSPPREAAGPPLQHQDQTRAGRGGRGAPASAPVRPERGRFTRYCLRADLAAGPARPAGLFPVSGLQERPDSPAPVLSPTEWPPNTRPQPPTERGLAGQGSEADLQALLKAGRGRGGRWGWARVRRCGRPPPARPGPPPEPQASAPPVPAGAPSRADPRARATGPPAPIPYLRPPRQAAAAELPVPELRQDVGGRRRAGSAPAPPAGPGSPRRRRRHGRSSARTETNRKRPLPPPLCTERRERPSAAPPPGPRAHCAAAGARRGGGPLGNVVRLGVARMRGGASRQGAGGEGGRAIPRRPPGSPPTLPGRLRRSLLGAAEAAGPWQEGAQVYFRYNAPLCFTGTVLFLLLPAEVSGPDTQAELKSTAQNPRSCLNQMKETTKQRPVTAWRAQTTRQTFKTKLLCPGRQGESCRHTNCWAKQNCNASKGYKKKPNPTLKVRGDRAPWEDRGELLTKVQAAAPRDLRGDSGPKGTTITSGRPTPSLAYWRLSRGLEILSPARQSSPAPLLGERARNAASDMGAQNHDRFKRGPWLIFHFNFPLLYKEQEKAMKTLGINMMLSNTAQPVLWWHLGDIFGSFPASHLTTPLTTMNNAWAWWWSQFYL